MMRIITGKARGVRLKTLPGDDVTRPTTERVKESVFSSLQFEIEGRRVLDLFAGSGQMGLEAMSRGAKSCTFVDVSSDACAIVADNVRATRLNDNTRVVNSSADRFCRHSSEVFDVVFLDPPYALGILPDLLPLVLLCVAKGGVVVCETDASTTLPETYLGQACSLVLEKQRRYGKTLIWIFRCQVNGKDDIG